MKRIIVFTLMLVGGAGTLMNCNGSKKLGSGFNLFPVEQDIQLGAQVAAEIDGNPNEYPLLDSASNKEVYKYLYKIRMGNFMAQDSCQLCFIIQVFQNPGVHINVSARCTKCVQCAIIADNSQSPCKIIFVLHLS